MEQLILITGGSEGIGAATALLAAKKGYTVCVNYLQNHEAASTVVKEIQNKNGKAFAIQANVSKEEDVLRMFGEIDQSGVKLTALVNNAGIVGTGKTLLQDMSYQRMQNVFAVNVIGSLLCAREAVKRMSTKNNGAGGNIVNVSSAATRLGAPFEYIDYAASKGAIDTMTIGLSKEVAEAGIRVNAVRPGIIITALHAKGGQPDRVEMMKANIPMKRGGTAEEVANTILWLLSDEASYITGAFVDVSGGR
jgi:NAD(P)-dependent dehydrogenase (short-subunit alcohol dehydrogenase family)